jgi:hypothetical protein
MKGILHIRMGPAKISASSCLAGANDQQVKEYCLWKITGNYRNSLATGYYFYFIHSGIAWCQRIERTLMFDPIYERMIFAPIGQRPEKAAVPKSAGRLV